MRNGFLGLAFLAVALLFVSGCEKQKPAYNGSVKVVRVNGEVTQVEVVLPGQTITITNREDANVIIAHLEAMTQELKNGRDQFRVQEPTPTPGK